MADIEIRNASPGSVTVEEIGALSHALRELESKPDVTAEEKHREGYGVTYFEIVRLVLCSEIVIHLVEKIADVTIDWAHDRFKKTPEKRRPTYVQIYGPDGKTIVKAVLIKDATNVPEDRTEEELQRVREWEERNKGK